MGRIILLVISILAVASFFGVARELSKGSTKQTRRSSLGFPAFTQAEFTLDVPVLTYHYIREAPNQEEDPLGFSLSVTPADFREQMNYLAEHGYRTITPAELHGALKNKTLLPPKSVLLTFDDGYEDFYTNAFPILKEFGLKATVFVVTGFAGSEPTRYLSWPQIRELDASQLVTIASHTIAHTNLMKSRNAFREISQSKRILERQLQHKVSIFAYPFGMVDEFSKQLVAQAGYDLAFSTRIGTTMHYSGRFALPRVRVSGGLAVSQFPGKLLPIPEKPPHQAEAFDEPVLAR